MKLDGKGRSIKGDRYLFVLFIGLTVILSSCRQNSLNQCEQIFRIAKEIESSSQTIVYEQDETNLKTWLEAASMMEKAADKIQALHINNSELIKHQHKLSRIYRIYAQTTYNAVKARESKNLEALKFARLNVQKAGKMHQESVEALNSYCLNPKKDFN